MQKQSASPMQTNIKQQLFPDKYALLAMTAELTWVHIAAIDVTTTTETWTVNQVLLNNLSTFSQITLQKVTTLPTIETPLTQTTPAQVAWSSPEQNPAYPTAGSTFAGNYIYSASGANGTLALNLQTSPTRSGAKLSEVTWFNPNTSGANVGLQYQPGNRITMPGTSGSYQGTCSVAASEMSP